MPDLMELVEKYGDKFEEPFPYFEAVKEEDELAKRIQECLDKGKRYTELYPTEKGVLY